MMQGMRHISQNDLSLSASATVSEQLRAMICNWQQQDGIIRAHIQDKEAQ